MQGWFHNSLHQQIKWEKKPHMIILTIAEKAMIPIKIRKSERTVLISQP